MPIADWKDLLVSSTYRTPDRRAHRWDATTAPAVTDDEADGYREGSLWYDATGDTLYLCTDPSTGAAAWRTVGTGDDGGTLHIDLTVSGAHTADRADGATHDLTLTGNATITPDHSAAVAGETIDLRLLVRQDGTGGRTLAWGGTIAWATADGDPPDMPTAANAMLTVGLLSVDDGTTWIGYAATGGGAPATTVESETSFGLSAAVGTDTEYARQDHTHGTPANPVTAAAISALGFVGPILISDSHATPIPFDDLLLTDDEDDILYADL
jgi:hypothetical protein